MDKLLHSGRNAHFYNFQETCILLVYINGTGYYFLCKKKSYDYVLLDTMGLKKA